MATGQVFSVRGGKMSKLASPRAWLQFVGALGGLTGALLGVASPSFAVEGCRPPGGLTKAETARATSADGTKEVTEFLQGGSYRVTRCDAQDRFLTSVEVAPYTAPDGARVMVPVMF